MELGPQFDRVFIPAGTRSPNDNFHRVEARQGDKPVSYVSWNPGNNTIHGAWTDNDFQGQGIASGLVRHIAEEHMPIYPNGRKAQLNHSSKRSPAGDALARKTSDFTYVPRNENAPKGQKYLKPGSKSPIPFTPDI